MPHATTYVRCAGYSHVRNGTPTHRACTGRTDAGTLEQAKRISTCRVLRLLQRTPPGFIDAPPPPSDPDEQLP